MLFRFLLFTWLVVGCSAPRPPTTPMDPSAPAGPTQIVAPDAAKERWDDPSAGVPVSSDDPSWGSREAPVTLVLFSDFECSYCARLRDTLHALQTRYGTQRLRIVWKHFPLPFHTNAGPAAEAAAGVFALAGDTAFWRFHDKAFEEQEALAPERFEGWARQSGVVAVQRFRIGMASHEWASKVEKDKTLGERLGIRGTPQSFVNGVPVEGAQGVGRFAAVIDLEEVKAKAQLAKGTPVSRIYAEMSRQNRKMEPADDAEDDHKVWRVPVGAEPSQGPKSALVTMVEFSDFQCGFCARASGTVGSLRRHYGDLLRVVWRNRPLAFHDRAAPCAEFAMEARTQRGDPGFWAAHDALFAAQSDQSDGALATMAQRLGLDGGRTMAAVQSRAHRADLKRDADLADDLDVTGTPTFFINGRRLVGAQPEDVFRGVIDEELTKARALVAAGTPPERVYAEVTRHGIVKATPRVQP